VRDEVEARLGDLGPAAGAEAVFAGLDPAQRGLDHPELLLPGMAEILEHLVVLALLRPARRSPADGLIEIGLDPLEPGEDLVPAGLQLEAALL
jgi:hypothetical protein